MARALQMLMRHQLNKVPATSSSARTRAEEHTTLPAGAPGARGVVAAAAAGNGSNGSAGGGDGGGGDGASDGGGRPAETGEAAASLKAVTPEEVFSLCDASGDGQLDREEFRSMFKLLDLNLGDAKEERLCVAIPATRVYVAAAQLLLLHSCCCTFGCMDADAGCTTAPCARRYALCDLDCDGTITEDEFVRSWDLVMGELLDESAEAAGLGRLQILLIVGCATNWSGTVSVPVPPSSNHRPRPPNTPPPPPAPAPAPAAIGTGTGSHRHRQPSAPACAGCRLSDACGLGVLSTEHGASLPRCSCPLL